MVCSESEVCFEIAVVPNTVNVLKSRQKREIRQCPRIKAQNVQILIDFI